MMQHVIRKQTRDALWSSGECCFFSSGLLLLQKKKIQTPKSFIISRAHSFKSAKQLLKLLSHLWTQRKTLWWRKMWEIYFFSWSWAFILSSFPIKTTNNIVHRQCQWGDEEIGEKIGGEFFCVCKSQVILWPQLCNWEKGGGHKMFKISPERNKRTSGFLFCLLF